MMGNNSGTIKEIKGSNEISLREDPLKNPSIQLTTRKKDV